jgi:hypothetical protein
MLSFVDVEAQSEVLIHPVTFLATAAYSVARRTFHEAS